MKNITKNKITVENIMKVIDIQKTAIHSATWHFLNNYFVAFKDNCLKENLVNIYDAMYEVTEEEPEYLPSNMYTSIIIQEVKELRDLCDNNDAGYIRFIES
jgi:hypothetical protein